MIEETRGEVFMATIREGNKSALLVVDVQVGVVRTAWEAPRIISNILLAVEKARAQGVPVIWVQHADNDLVSGSPDWEWVPDLLPAEDEVRIHKHFNSSFEQTTLEETLARMGISHIYLAGAATNWCIRATAYAVLERGYDLTLVSNAHTTESMEFKDGTVIPAESIIRELNVAMNWLSYPGRGNYATPAVELTF
jgi:nicotinamidase-related amidase